MKKATADYSEMTADELLAEVSRRPRARVRCMAGDTYLECFRTVEEIGGETDG